MLDFLNTVIPNVMDKPDELWTAVVQTLYMLVVSGLIAFVFGLFFGTVLTVTAPSAIMENRIDESKAPKKIKEQLDKLKAG